MKNQNLFKALLIVVIYSYFGLAYSMKNDSARKSKRIEDIQREIRQIRNILDMEDLNPNQRKLFKDRLQKLIDENDTLA